MDKVKSIVNLIKYHEGTQVSTCLILFDGEETAVVEKHGHFYPGDFNLIFSKLYDLGVIDGYEGNDANYINWEVANNVNTYTESFSVDDKAKLYDRSYGIIYITL